MRLTRRGKRVRALVIALLLVALAYALTILDPVYGQCEQTIEGEVCKLIRYEIRR